MVQDMVRTVVVPTMTRASYLPSAVAYNEQSKEMVSREVKSTDWVISQCALLPMLLVLGADNRYELLP